MKSPEYSVRVPGPKAPKHLKRRMLFSTSGSLVCGSGIDRLYKDGRAVLFRDTDAEGNVKRTTRTVRVALPDGWFPVARELVAQSLDTVADCLEQVRISRVINLPDIARDAAAWEDSYSDALEAGADTSALERRAKLIQHNHAMETEMARFYECRVNGIAEDAIRRAQQHGFDVLAAYLVVWSQGLLLGETAPGAATGTGFEEGWIALWRYGARKVRQTEDVS